MELASPIRRALGPAVVSVTLWLPSALMPPLLSTPPAPALAVSPLAAMDCCLATLRWRISAKLPVPTAPPLAPPVIVIVPEPVTN